MKKLSSCFAFLLVFSLLFICVNHILRPKKEVEWLNGFYALPENTLDVIFLGSSHLFRDINPGVLEDEYGISSYCLAAPAQPVWNSYYYLVECLKTQTPQIVVLECYMTIYGEEYMEEHPEQIYASYIGMRLSKNKLDALEVAPKGMRADLLLGFPTYHNRYNQLTAEDFSLSPTPVLDRGYEAVYDVMPQVRGEVSTITQRQALPAKSAEYVRKIIDLAHQNNIKVILMLSPVPQWYLELIQPFMHDIEEIAAETGCRHINFNDSLYDEAFDYETNYSDPQHMNVYGSARLSALLGDIMREEYGL